MKIVHPILHELRLVKAKLERAEIERDTFKTKVHILEQDNLQLKAIIARQKETGATARTWARLASPPITPPASTRGLTPSPSPQTMMTRKKKSNPTYAAPTKASLAKSNQNNTASLCPTNTSSTDEMAAVLIPLPTWPGCSQEYYMYQDGLLVKRPAHYIKATIASRARRHERWPCNGVKSFLSIVSTCPFERLPFLI